MLDPKLIRHNLADVEKKIALRGGSINVTQLEALEKQRKVLQTSMENLQNKRNLSAKSIGAAKAAGEDISVLLKKVESLKSELDQVEQQYHNVEHELQQLLAMIPNIPHDSVPVGKTEEDNVEVRRWGELPTYSFPIKDHVDLAEAQDWMSFSKAALLTGSRFVVMQGPCARLHRALIQFMLDIQIQEHGYQEVYVPYIVNSDALFATGQLPKFAEDQFVLEGEHTFYLIPTAEVPLTNLVQQEILEPAQLPRKWVAHTPCFRREAGSYGKDTRGMIRQHQFEKVELVWIVKPEESYAVLEELTANAETILQRLELPYRVMALCTADLGFSAAKTYDLEVWLPSQQCYREISSCSNMEAFQARRLHARWRDPASKKPQLVHTLNGSGLAVGRCLVAILENYQTEAGDVIIPAALQPYVGGKSRLSEI